MSLERRSLLAMPSQRLLLVASLALNLFFAGAAVAVAFHRMHGPPPAGRSQTVHIDRLAATLPAADAAVLRARFGDIADSLAAAEQASRLAQDKARSAISATPFDESRGDQAFVELRAARRAVWLIVHKAILDAAKDMSQEGRDQLAAWVPPGPARAGGATERTKPPASNGGQ
ncbi:periplasmic heavy metal sensor [Xanthobacter versatilis]|uniref:periplasmic heavy metal sensor n=1 Tax=Xanthobacter autotrophicus (strain ATCC BAA-1158 / Py2) TaxID=78245 RepID=UPI00372A4D96